MKKMLVFFITGILMMFGMKAFAWDNVRTHPKLTEKAAEVSKLDDYLEKTLNFPLKQNTELYLGGVGYNTILGWLMYGSDQEDRPDCRAANHFHNPLKSWDQSGLTDINWIQKYLCSATTDYNPGDIKSAITWATTYKSPTQRDSYFMLEGLNDWTWYKGRLHFYEFWTGAGSAVGNSVYRERELTFAFQSLGQVLHLLQDMAVPAHVRNDFTVGHLEDNPMYIPTDTKTERLYQGNRFELYVKMYSPAAGKINVGDPYSWFHPAKYNKDAREIDLTEKTLTNFWDTDTYNGEMSISTSQIGLSEYSNFNFISEGAMFPEQCKIEGDVIPDRCDKERLFPWPKFRSLPDI